MRILNLFLDLFFGPKAKFTEVLNDYFNKKASKSEGLSSETIKKHGYFHQNILAFLKASRFEDVRASRIKISTMLRMEEWLIANRACSNNYASRHVKHCSEAIDLAIINEKCNHNPIAVMTAKQDKVKDVISLSPEDIVKIIKYEYKTETEFFVVVLFLFLCFTGLSYCDLWQYIIKKDFILVDGEKMEIEMITGKNQSGRGKNKRPYWAELNSHAREIHDMFNGNLPYVCLNTFNDVIKKISRSVGFENWMEMSTHVGRKTYANLRFRQGMSLEAISNEMGNTVEVLLKHYIKTSPDRVKSEIPRLKGIPIFDLN
jgi:hypothetical protein